jgi:uncharacterized protein (TIGR00369 family)
MDVAAENEKAFFETVARFYENQLPFNRVLGIRVTSVSADGGTMTFPIRGDLIGNSFQGTLHGGVISAVLDAVGGLTALASLVGRIVGVPTEDAVAIVSKAGTIDLRVDYLRPGRGAWFTARGRMMRAGRKVAVVRMELHNDDDLLVAVGTGTYMIG